MNGLNQPPRLLPEVSLKEVRLSIAHPFSVGGNREVIYWLYGEYEHAEVEITSAVFNTAARHNLIAVIDWLEERRITSMQSCSRSAALQAAEGMFVFCFFSLLSVFVSSCLSLPLLSLSLSLSVSLLLPHCVFRWSLRSLPAAQPNLWKIFSSILSLYRYVA
jgi:hypothetical protein